MGSIIFLVKYTPELIIGPTKSKFLCLPDLGDGIMPYTSSFYIRADCMVKRLKYEGSVFLPSQTSSMNGEDRIEGGFCILFEFLLIFLS